MNWVSIGSDNGLSPGRRQAIIWTIAGILLIVPLEINVSEILIKISTFSFQENAFANIVCEISSRGRWVNQWKVSRKFPPRVTVILKKILWWHAHVHHNVQILTNGHKKTKPKFYKIKKEMLILTLKLIIRSHSIQSYQITSRHNVINCQGSRLQRRQNELLLLRRSPRWDITLPEMWDDTLAIAFLDIYQYLL